MTGIGNQGDRIRQEAEAAFERDEHHIECHGEPHPQIDPATTRQCMTVPVGMPMFVRMLVLVVGEVIMFHWFDDP
jgi:hypothetical protein